MSKYIDNRTLYESDEYRGIWLEVHNELVNDMVKKLEHYVEKYLDSPAGMVFTSLVSDNRYHLRLT